MLGFYSRLFKESLKRKPRIGSNHYFFDSLYGGHRTERDISRGVRMRKLAPARVSYRDDFLILYRVYMLTGSFHIAFYMIVMKVHFILIKYKCETKSYTLRMRYPFPSTSRPISHRNEWSFRVCMILLRNFVPE